MTREQLASWGKDALDILGAWEGLAPVSASAATPLRRARQVEPGKSGTIRPELPRTRAVPSFGTASPIGLAGDGIDGTHDLATALDTPAPYLEAIFSLHGQKEDLSNEELLSFRRDIAKVVFHDDFENDVEASPMAQNMNSALGTSPLDWVIIKQVLPLNCSAAHECDDEGRRRRRLLSFDGATSLATPRAPRVHPRRPARGRRTVPRLSHRTARRVALLRGESHALERAKLEVNRLQTKLLAARRQQGQIDRVREHPVGGMRRGVIRGRRLVPRMVPGQSLYFQSWFQPIPHRSSYPYWMRRFGRDGEWNSRTYLSPDAEVDVMIDGREVPTQMADLLAVKHPFSHGWVLVPSTAAGECKQDTQLMRVALPPNDEVSQVPCKDVVLDPVPYSNCMEYVLVSRKDTFCYDAGDGSNENFQPICVLKDKTQKEGNVYAVTNGCGRTLQVPAKMALPDDPNAPMPPDAPPPRVHWHEIQDSEVDDFSFERRVDVRIFVPEQSFLKHAAHSIKNAVHYGTLSHEMSKQGFEIEVGLLRILIGFNMVHECVWNCPATCGDAPLPPCPPVLIEGGKFVGEAYYLVHIMYVHVSMEVNDDATKSQVNRGAAVVVYTLDNSEPTCESARYAGEPLTFNHTTFVKSATCRLEDQRLSHEVAQAEFVVLPATIPDHFPCTWRSQDGKHIRVTAPFAAFEPPPNCVMIQWADLQHTSEVCYSDAEMVGADRNGPEGLQFEAVEGQEFPQDAQCGKGAQVRTNEVEVEVSHKSGDDMAEEEDVFQVILPDGAEIDVAPKDVEFEAADDEQKEMAKIHLPDGRTMEVPISDIELVHGNPNDPLSSWSKHRMPGVVVDRLPGSVESERELVPKMPPELPGTYGEYPVVWKSYDSSTIRIEAPANQFQLPPSLPTKNWLAEAKMKKTGQEVTVHYTIDADGRYVAAVQCAPYCGWPLGIPSTLRVLSWADPNPLKNATRAAPWGGKNPRDVVKNGDRIGQENGESKQAEQRELERILKPNLLFKIVATQSSTGEMILSPLPGEELPRNIASVAPAEYSIIAIRPGRMEVEIAGPADDFFPMGPFAIAVHMDSGRKIHMWYESVGVIRSRHGVPASLILTIGHGEQIPEGALYISPDPEGYVKGLHFDLGFPRPPKSWMDEAPNRTLGPRGFSEDSVMDVAGISEDGSTMRVKDAFDLLLHGDSEIRVVLANGSIVDVEYSKSVPASDNHEDAVLLAVQGESFPKDGTGVLPNRLTVVAVKADRTQVQIMGDTRDLHAGPGSIKLLLSNNGTAIFAYETAVQLPGNEGFLVTALGSEKGHLFPENFEAITEVPDSQLLIEDEGLPEKAILVINPRTGEEKVVNYDMAKVVEADEDGPAGIELSSVPGAFEGTSGSWVKSNVPEPAGLQGPKLDDTDKRLERAGVNVKGLSIFAGSRTDSFVPNQGPRPISPLISEENTTLEDDGGRAGATSPSAKAREQGPPGILVDGMPWDASSEPIEKVPSERSKMHDEVVEAQHAAQRARVAREAAEREASEMQSQVEHLQDKIKELEARAAAAAKEKAAREKAASESWFDRVNEARRGGMDDDKWPATSREEAEAAQGAQPPRRIPIGANHPEPERADGAAPTPVRQEAADGCEDGNRFPVLAVSKSQKELRVAAPNDGSFPQGPARLVVETASGGAAFFGYQWGEAVSEATSGGGTVTSGILFHAEKGGIFPLDAAYACAGPRSTTFPIISRTSGGHKIELLAPNDGTFLPAPATIKIEALDGEAASFSYCGLSFRKQDGSHQKEDSAALHGVLVFKACDGTAFPQKGAFAGPGKDDEVVGAGGKGVFKVLWVSTDGRQLKAEAPNDGTFNLGPSRIKVVVPGGGVELVPYDSVALAASDDHGPAGLLFDSIDGAHLFPQDAWRVAPGAFPEPYPIVARASDGAWILVAAPNDGTLAPGPGKLRLRTSDDFEMAFPYSYIAVEPAKDGRPAGLKIEAPAGVAYPATGVFVGPLQGVAPQGGAGWRAATAHNEQWPEAKAGEGSVCRPSTPKVGVAAVESEGSVPPKTGTLCIDEPIFADRKEPVVRSIPGPLIGQTMVMQGDTDRFAAGSTTLSLSLREPAYVFLIWDARGTPEGGGVLPAWVQGSYTLTGEHVLTSGGPLVVLRSSLPLTGEVYLGGLSAPPSRGAEYNYLVAVVEAGAAAQWRAGASPGTDGELGESWLVPEEGKDHVPLRVLMYDSPGKLLLRTEQQDALKRDGGMLRVVDGGEVTRTGALVAYSKAEPISEGEPGYPGFVVTAAAAAFPKDLSELLPASYKVGAIRPGGAQLQLNGPCDGFMASGPGTLQAVRSDGSASEINYQSVACLPKSKSSATTGDQSSSDEGVEGGDGGNQDAQSACGGLLITAPEGTKFPEDAVRVELLGNGKEAVEGGSSPGKEGEDVDTRSENKPTGSEKTDAGDNRSNEDEGKPGSDAEKGSGGFENIKDCDKGAAFPDWCVGFVDSSYPVVAETDDGKSLRVVASDAGMLEPGPSKIRLQLQDGGGWVEVPYESVAPVLEDGLGPAGLLLTAPDARAFPKGIQRAAPVAFRVLAERRDSAQLQVAAALSDFPDAAEGPGTVLITRGDGSAAEFPFETVAELWDGTGVLLTAPEGTMYPQDAAFVSPGQVAGISGQGAAAGAAAGVFGSAVGGLDGAEGEIGKFGAAAPAGSKGDSNYQATIWMDSHPTGKLVVTQAHSDCGRGGVEVGVATPGARLYADVTAIKLEEVPAQLLGQPYAMGADAAKDCTSFQALTMTLSELSDVFLLIDPRETPSEGGMLPTWVNSGFKATDLVVRTSDAEMPTMAVYKSKAPLIGPVSLGGSGQAPAEGARHAIVAVMKAAPSRSTFAAPDKDEEYERGAAGTFGAQGRDEDTEASESGALEDDKLGREAAAITAAALDRIVESCGGEDVAEGCLEQVHTCMQPYKMGDMASCRLAPPVLAPPQSHPLVDRETCVW